MKPIDFSDIVSELSENVCNDIGTIRKYPYKIVDGKKIWYKFCPKCNAEQCYNALRSIWKATKENRVCYSCKNSGNNNPFFGKKHSEAHKTNLSDKQLKCSYRYKSIGNNPPKIKVVCETCKTVFYVIKSRSKQAKYCTYECAAKDAYGFSKYGKTVPEKKMENILQLLGETYCYGYYLGGKIYDFYLPKYNLLIEVDGIYWHGKGLTLDEMNNTQKSNRQNDIKKVAIALSKGYRITRIWEDEMEVKVVSEHIRR